jgi:vacuolar protein sorting-associated protein 13A/C
VLSLGKLFMQTEPRPLISRDVKAMHESGASQDEILAEMILQSYDKFMLEIQNIQAIVAAPTENWQNTILENNVTDMHILQPTTLKLSAHLCVIEDDPRLPKCKITGEIPKIHINVTESRILDAFSIVTSLPLPENEELPSKMLSKVRLMRIGWEENLLFYCIQCLSGIEHFIV